MNPVVIVVGGAVAAAGAAAAGIARWWRRRRKKLGDEQGTHTRIPSAAAAKSIVTHFERPELMDYEMLRLSIREYFEPGMYAWYFDDVPPAARHDKCHKYGKWTLLYVGKTSVLGRRLLQRHFGGSAGDSTLRLTLGCLLGMQLYVRGKNRDWWFGPEGEKRLSNWLREHARVAVARVEGDLQDWTERMLIDHFWLPLNLDLNRKKVCGTVRAIRDACKDAAIPYGGEE